MSEHDDRPEGDDELEDESPEPRKAGDTFADIEPAPMPPMTTDGGPAMQAPGPPPRILPATPEHMVCLRGPCRHYWEVKLPFAAGNPEGTWEELDIEAPKETLRTCLASPSREFDLGDICPLECNLWEPRSQEDEMALFVRRQQYFEAHPHIMSPGDEDDIIEDDHEPAGSEG